MRIEDHLNTEQKRQLDGMRNVKKKKRKKRKERVDWVDIMGMNRDRYGRGRGGAVRRK